MGDGVQLQVLVQPRASRSRVVGLHDDRLKLQVAAPPVEGEANDAVLRLLAEVLEVPRRQLELVQGETARRKTVLVRGITPDRVEQLLGAAGLRPSREAGSEVRS